MSLPAGVWLGGPGRLPAFAEPGARGPRGLSELLSPPSMTPQLLAPGAPASRQFRVIGPFGPLAFRGNTPLTPTSAPARLPPSGGICKSV